VRSRGRTVRRFLKKLKIELPHDPAIPLLGIYPDRSVIQEDTGHLNVHSSTIRNTQDIGKLKCPSTGEWVKKMKCVCLCVCVCISSFQFSCSVVSDSLWPHGLQHTTPLCPSPTPGVYSNSCPLSQWCHPTISSSVVPFSSCLQSFPASESFQMSQLFTSGGQSIGVSASASVLLMNIQDWFPLGSNFRLDLLAVQGTQESSPRPQFKSINSLVLSFLHSPILTSIHDYWKNHSFD